jgi:hypothetical protein
MNPNAAPQKSARPYFVPEDVDFDALPESVKLAFQTIVQPAYDELVLAAPNALERAVGTSFVFLLAEEVLDHFEIGRQMDLSQTHSVVDRQQRDQALSRHLKLLGAKNAALYALLRVRRLPSLTQFSVMGPAVV